MWVFLLAILDTGLTLEVLHPLYLQLQKEKEKNILLLLHFTMDRKDCIDNKFALQTDINFW